MKINKYLEYAGIIDSFCLLFFFFVSEHKVPPNDRRALCCRRNTSDKTSKRNSHITTERVG